MIALRSSVARSKRVVPSRAVSFGAGAVSIVKSLTVTEVDPLVSVSPPLWVMLPASVLASTLPPVIGKARLPSAVGRRRGGRGGRDAQRGQRLRGAGIERQRGGSAREGDLPGRRLDRRRPDAQAAREGVDAEGLVERGGALRAEPDGDARDGRAQPGAATFALASESENAVRRALPALTDSDGVLSTPIVKLVSRTRVAPARSCRPPLWVIVPAAVAGSIVPPVIGNEMPLEPAFAGPIGGRPRRGPSAPWRCRRRA